MGLIEEKVTKLIKKHGTNNPFEIANQKGVIVRYVPLGNVLGFHARYFRTSIIHINEALSEQQQLFTCAHELGHAIFHPDANTPFLKKNTYYSTDKIEVEANEFAVELLFSQDTNNSITIKEATQDYGIPEQLLYKKFYT
ncbi:ImmA/IrrE family metallo-endopeptidase [Oceanobacillus sp. J11TS1]|uniref:ImmA/IrrE family metallo-endopeptidase n=1 Tax=Oceanobacillus sp. J11TS1 TaxID=2807191 RepID=UPI001B2E1392|nr:ImmA/IrrE family metallo-endopeptidase [Oceanobacillus sp. J11TS1]GIO22468.1 hypothetical protein J11TS1_10490 [Oceanobacillus sp. J11TS1]